MRRIHFVIVLLLMLFGCDDGVSTTATTVNVQSFLMDTHAFDLEAVIAKIKEGNLSDAQALEKFINDTSSINNVDLDKDGKVDELTVKEEKNGDGKIAMAVVAHPKTGEESVIAELNFEKNTTTKDVVVSGAYPEYVHGYQNHYYSHTLTGSTIGDLMFYSWMFSPHPLYMPTYHYGMYSSGGRSVMSRQQLSSSRTTYRTNTKMAPVQKQVRPSSYKPTTKAAQKTASSFKKQTAARNAKLSSRSGTSKSFSSRSGTKTRSSGFGSSRRSSFGSSRSFSSGSRRSSAKYKHDIHYLDGSELSSYADQLHSMPLATWRYNDQEDNQTHLGIITEDVGAESVATSSDLEYVDLYSYTSMAVAAIQIQQDEIESLKSEVQAMRAYVLTGCE